MDGVSNLGGGCSLIDKKKHTYLFVRHVHPGGGRRGGAVGVRHLPAGGAGPRFGAGLQREAASPAEAEARPGAAQPAAGPPRHLPTGTEASPTDMEVMAIAILI